MPGYLRGFVGVVEGFNLYKVEAWHLFLEHKQERNTIPYTLLFYFS
jgi:hypothetical protein